ncbi:16S rRNA (guanine(966)-N(2))-methyltransferase RsmD [Pseudoxanthomonas sp. Root630]|uniref:16S rRNA (guanine(966)-N(2))-methyltransferase RsmD n=1 Tax=Pseudoxanthomonas sp. Root630 TaxID=1736574 RepID=UPI00070317C3|nr:16S rRNA (guanine(966)-N(2))-methyltransferase RsmD [Pseudoxanthomonas sp. Root630]KRA52081.1 16S rRNA (guanine(966)-N(2))-methyltransferase RsmD [Pseudoxanthomonas sp. Root630]
MPRKPSSPRQTPSAPAARGAGQVRIIGGRWRGTKLAVPDRQGLRPSSDRVRETLFNWLMPVLPGARVLDLFAGTGALGLEALSRGAAHAVLVERDPDLARALREAVGRLGAEATVVAQDALVWLSSEAARFDLVFLDPPFADGLWERALAALSPRLATDAWVYVEAPAGTIPAVPPGWALHREGQTRDVRYALYRTPGAQAAVTLRPDDSPATTA